MKTYVYFYLMKKEPEKIGRVVPSHVEYWKRKNLDHYQGGPFADRTGGLITFAADNLDIANEIIGNDPFIINDLIDKKWIKEWLQE